MLFLWFFNILCYKMLVTSSQGYNLLTMSSDYIFNIHLLGSDHYVSTKAFTFNLAEIKENLERQQIDHWYMNTGLVQFKIWFNLNQVISISPYFGIEEKGKFEEEMILTGLGITIEKTEKISIKSLRRIVVEEEKPSTSKEIQDEQPSTSKEIQDEQPSTSKEIKDEQPSTSEEMKKRYANDPGQSKKTDESNKTEEDTDD
ncbi:hypothetical protein EHP00_1437 [Ecytonucleospora hepatopenaei]|uniref:Uncharacterized protein n=1 Tax=Ecytonucleospora hepatopenaei TaxID=646526 RepID=A0A1W0E7I8_9MICR|nr:hypothetical protein EHP00_1437 [Ecytonucleospora hepatopenaei]